MDEVEIREHDMCGSTAIGAEGDGLFYIAVVGRILVLVVTEVAA